jgi:hypothetical protein
MDEIPALQQRDCRALLENDNVFLTLQDTQE